MQRSYTGRRRNFIVLFILSLVGILVALKGKATGRLAGIQPPADLRASMQRILSNPANWILVSKMETAAWSSGAYVNARNPWGMQRAQVRSNHQDGTYQGSSGSKLASYDTIDRAVLDLQDWVSYTNFPTYSMDLEQHLNEMKKRGYFVESLAEYLNLVNAWSKK